MTINRLFDRVMLVVYILFLCDLAVSVQAMRFVEKQKVPEAEKLEATMQNLILLLVPLLCFVYMGLST